MKDLLVVVGIILLIGFFAAATESLLGGIVFGLLAAFVLAILAGFGA